MLNLWRRAIVRERNAGFREGYAAGLRDAHRLAQRRRLIETAAELEDLARSAQLAADAANGRAS